MFCEEVFEILSGIYFPLSQDVSSSITQAGSLLVNNASSWH